MEASNKGGGIKVIVVAAVAVTLIAIVAVANVRKQMAAKAIVEDTEALTIGSLSRLDYEKQTEGYRQYRTEQEITLDGTPQRVVRFTIPGGWRSRTLLGVSANFADGRLVSRSIGLLREGCCSVNVDQSLLKKQSGIFQRSEVVRRTAGNSNHLEFDVSPDMIHSEQKRILNFRINCLLPFSRCKSVDQLNPATSELVRASDRAGS